MMKNRPVSARRSIPQQNFSTYLSRQRLRSVQALLKQDDVNKDAPDTVVSILGIDSRYNEGCRELADYLLFGFFTLRQMELEKAGLEEEDIEDIIIAVRHDSVSVYCGFMLYDYLLPYVAHWPNLQIFCRSQSTEDPNRDTDIEEEYKVRSFVSMLEGCVKVGVPYLSSSMAAAQPKGSPAKNADNQALEKWPLIQSYALEGIGCGAFFTIKHNVTNVRDQLLSLYYQCDPVVLERTVSKSYPLFSRHWGEAVTTIENAALGNRLPQLQEDQILEPLQCYFKHGQLSKLRLGKKSTPEAVATSRQPFVLFGARTQGSAKGSKPATLKAGAGKGQNTALHMVMQCVAPRSPVTCTRTYFFKPGENMREFNDLVQLYKTCVEGCSHAIREFTSSLSPVKAERKAIDHMLSVGLAGGLVFDAKCKVSACDSVGREVKMTEGKQNPCMKVIRVAAENIKTSHKGDTIGSVIFTDTFLDSSFPILEDVAEVDSSPSDNAREATFTVITSDIPNFMEWKVKTQSKSDEKPLSEPLAVCQNVTVCSNSPLYSPPCKATLTFHQDGKMTVGVAKAEVATVQSGATFFDGVSPGKVGLLVVNFDVTENAPLWNAVSHHWRSEVILTPDPVLPKLNKCLIFALMPRTQAYKEFYAKVLHKPPTTESRAIPVKILTGLPPDLAFIYQAIQNVFEKSAALKRESFQQFPGLQPHPKFSDFLTHYTVSSVVGDHPVPRSSVDILLKKTSQTQTSVTKTPDKDDKVCITVLIGLPCSGANELSLQLINLNKEKVRWVVVRPLAPSQSSMDGTVDRNNLEEQLAQAISRKNPARPSAAARKKLRIIILAVGFFDICDVIQCVMAHPDAAVRKQMFIGAVTTCIWPESVFLENRQTFPRFLGHCSPGVISNFALTTTELEAADITDKNLATVQALVRTVNQRAAFMICHGGKLSRQSDFELVLSETSFDTLHMKRERQLLVPALSLGKQLSGHCRPDIRDATLEFSQPLIKGTFCAKLRALKSSLTSKQPTGGICFVTGCVTFLDAPTQEYDLSFATTVGEVQLTPRVIQSQVPAPPSENRSKTKQYTIKFYGMNLDVDALKDWLRKCGRQKPSKKCHKTRSNLTKAELKAINEDNKTKPLPEGYFFNGSYFVSLFDSEKSMEHPSIQRFVDDYMVKKNREIDAYNANIDRQNIKDVFGE